MKRIFLSVFTLLLLLAPIGLQPRASAIDLFNVCSNSNGSNCTDCKGKAAATDVCATVNSSSGNSVLNTIKIVIDIVSYAVGIAAVIMLVINGLKLVLSGGDAKAAEEGRKGITYALVGIAVVVSAQVLVQFVLNKL